MKPNTQGMFEQLSVFTQALLTLRLIYCTQMLSNYMYPNFGKTQYKHEDPWMFYLYNKPFILVIIQAS